MMVVVVAPPYSGERARARSPPSTTFTDAVVSSQDDCQFRCCSNCALSTALCYKRCVMMDSRLGANRGPQQRRLLAQS